MPESRAKELMLTGLRVGNASACAEQFAIATLAEWQETVRLARWHGVAPLLHRQLKTMRAQVPEEILQDLRAAYLQSAIRNKQLYRQLTEILECLGQEDIPVIPLKGVYLAEWVYRNWALRPMTDIDLLVRKDDVTRAAEALLAMGYSWAGDHIVEPTQAMIHHHLPPLVKANCVPLEAHWDLVSRIGPLKQWADPFTIDLSTVWQRARPVIIAGMSVQVLSTEDLLLHLCIHTAYHHGFGVRLCALFDIAEVIRCYQGEMDWRLVCQSARQWGIGRSVYLTLCLTKELLQVPVPPDVLETFKPQEFDPRLTLWAKEQILRDRDGAPADSLNITRVWRAAGLRGKIVNLLKIMFPPPQMIAALYSRSPRDKRIYLYYWVRFKDLMLKYFHFLWKLLLRDRATVAHVDRDEQTNALVDWLAAK